MRHVCVRPQVAATRILQAGPSYSNTKRPSVYSKFRHIYAILSHQLILSSLIATYVLLESLYIRTSKRTQTMSPPSRSIPQKTTFSSAELWMAFLQR